MHLENSSQQYLFPLHDLGDDEVPDEDDSEIYEEDKAPFDPEAVRVTPKPMPIDSVLKRVRQGEIDLAPGFQRQAGIWNNVAQSRLIESVILRIPLPAFYIDATNDDKWSVIDGLQRLTTFKKFILDQSLKLTGLEYFSSLTEMYFDNLPRSYQRRIEETTLNLYLIEKGSPPEVTFNIFKRVNTGGLPLSPQELRHALNYGKAATFLENLSKPESFRSLVKVPASKIKRMDDREYILGFVAFKLTDYKEYPKNTGRDAFLNDAMRQLNLMDEHSVVFSNLREALEKALEAAEKIFGDSAFRKISKVNPKKYPVNKALFEAWTVSLSDLSHREIDLLYARREELVDRFSELIDTNEEFARSVSQAANFIAVRFENIKTLINRTIRE
jgi:uncharacterized protein with ParB-like and HNH nuclease domain